jgi:hypothetical protein
LNLHDINQWYDDVIMPLDPYTKSYLMGNVFYSDDHSIYKMLMLDYIIVEEQNWLPDDKYVVEPGKVPWIIF